MRVELTGDATAFRTRDWTDLVLADPSGTFFHTPSYLKLWWEEFGSGELLLAFVQDHGRTVGAGAFELIADRLLFLGGLDVTDYLGPVASEGREREVARAMMSSLSTLGWSEADLRGLPADSAWIGALAEAAASLGLAVEEGPDGVAPYIDLAGSYQGYLAALPSKLRHELGRKERRLAGEPGGYRIELASLDSLHDDLDRFVELHRASPGPKGRFMQPGMEIFFRRLGETFLPFHQFRLAFVEADGTRVAGAIGFAFKNTFSLYNSAFDREAAHLSPGVVLVSGLIRRAIEAGRDRFDLLKGDLEYKYRFGSTPRPVRRMTIRR